MFPNRTKLLYEWRTILFQPLSTSPLTHTHTSDFLLSLSSTSPCSPAAGVTGSCRSEGSRVGAESRVDDLQWTCGGLRSSPVLEALNVAVAAMLGMWASALPGPDRWSPQLYLRKWQSGAHQPFSLLLFPFLCLIKAPLPSLYRNNNYCPFWGSLPYLLGWDVGEHSHVSMTSEDITYLHSVSIQQSLLHSHWKTKHHVTLSPLFFIM